MSANSARTGLGTSEAINPYPDATLSASEVLEAPRAVIVQVLEDYPGGTAAQARCALCEALWVARLARLHSAESWRCCWCSIEDNRTVWKNPVTEGTYTLAETSEAVIAYPDASLSASEVLEAADSPLAVAEVIGYAGRNGSGKRLVMVMCSCGQTWIARADNVRAGHSTRCPSCAMARRRLGRAA